MKRLPHDPPLRHHEFGPKMISVCVNLARTIGLRPTVTCLEIVFDWLGVNERGARLDDRSYLADACGSRGHPGAD